ncbi:MAG: alpha/beta family hydrolase [Nitrospiraceae bacterium]
MTYRNGYKCVFFDSEEHRLVVIRELTMHVSETAGHVAALLLRPEHARWLLVLAHGAGAGMRHTFMERLAHELAASEVATFRYQFPYMEQHRGRPDPPAVLRATVRAAIAAAAEVAPDLPLLAGGKSLGGRMSSHVLSEPPPTGLADATRRVRGLIFFGFPLHPPGRPGTQRAAHLERVEVPMLFLQGTRDTLADLALLRPLCVKLAPRATLHIVDTADHSFHVLKRSGTTDAHVLRHLARTAVVWADALG